MLIFKFQWWLLVLLLATLALSCQTKPQPEQTIAPSPTPKPPLKLDPYGGYPAPVLGKPYPGTGVVKIINLKEGWVEIEHQEIKDLMAPMTMEFWIRDRSIVKGVRVGDQVDFVIVEDSKGEYLTEIKKVPPAP
ncbi:MAG TPA: copper-binding protein [Pyrinomonadaceae bacterium]|nr:copper-binding protein [Pyrinomonadaceae bacterium]